MHKVVKNYYYKVAEQSQISGMHLCRPGEYVKDTRFIECRFHPNCADAFYHNCIFENCDGTQYFIPIKVSDCQFTKNSPQPEGG